MNVFLSGAIDGLEDLGGGWRAVAETELINSGYRVLNPLVNTLEQVFKTPNEIVAHDTFLRKRADILLVEYNIPNRCYIGTDYELVKAHEDGQPAIVWAHETLCSRVYLQHLATVILPTLEECLDYIQAYYPAYME